MRPRSRILVTALVLAPLNAAEFAGQDPAAESARPGSEHEAWRARLADDGRSLPLVDRSGSTCLECHAEVAEEWAYSTHATAWQDELYQKELKKIRRKQGCTGCHAPVNLHAAQEIGLPASPETRTELRHLGVSCESCHVAADGATILGPAGHATSAHPTEASPLFDSSVSNELCIACHSTTIGPVIGVAQDFVATDQEGLGNSCVGCHMPSVTRPWANLTDEAPDGSEAPPARRGRSHRLNTPRDPEFLATAFDLVASADARSVVVTIANLTGHRVPGLVERSLAFTLVARDAAGVEVGRATRVLDHKAYLPADEELEVPIEVTAEAARVEVTADHSAPGMKAPMRFLSREITPE